MSNNLYHQWMKQRELYENEETSQEAYALFAFDFYPIMRNVSNIAKLRFWYPNLNDSALLSIAHVMGIIEKKEQ